MAWGGVCLLSAIGRCGHDRGEVLECGLKEERPDAVLLNLEYLDARVGADDAVGGGAMRSKR